MTPFSVGCRQCQYAQYILSRALSFLPPLPSLVGPRVRGWEAKPAFHFEIFFISGSLVNLRNMLIKASDAKINHFSRFEEGFTIQGTSHVQGYLADKKQRHPRTLQ